MKLEKCCVSCKYFYILNDKNWCCIEPLDGPINPKTDGIDISWGKDTHSSIFDNDVGSCWEADPILLIPNCIQEWSNKLGA